MDTQDFPWILLEYEVTLNDSQLKDHFINELIQLGATLNLTETNESPLPSNVIKITKKDRNIIKNLCSVMFGKKPSNLQLQITIKFSKNNYSRLVELRVIEGAHYEGEDFIIKFIKKSVKFSKNIKIIKSPQTFFVNLDIELNKEFDNKNKNIYDYAGSFVGSQGNINENATILENINKEATKYYEIYKILSKENYELGKSVSIFLSDFKIKNENIDKACKELPKQMNEIIKMINTCEDTFNNYFNMGKNNDSNGYTMNKTGIRDAIEKFIFNKIYFQLYELYNKKYEEENKKYLENKERILNEFSIEETMEYLEIKPQFQCLNQYNSSGKSKFCLPYKSTIDYINKIEYEQNPKNKFDTLIEAGLELRNTVLGSGIKQELNSMDDELPIFIYCSTQINLKNAPAEFHMVEDYLRAASPEVDASKVVTNVVGSIYFISSSWNFEKNNLENEKEKEENKVKGNKGIDDIEEDKGTDNVDNIDNNEN